MDVGSQSIYYLPFQPSPVIPMQAGMTEKVSFNGFGVWVLGFGFWVLGFGFWVLGFGFCF
jgi:hypothetical protein